MHGLFIVIKAFATQQSAVFVDGGQNVCELTITSK